MTTKNPRIGILGALALILVLSGHSYDNTARSVLVRVLQRQRSVDYVRIESRPSSQGGPEWRLKVQTVKDLGIKVRIMGPLSQEGVVSIDDAKELRTYFPDEDTVLIQPSPFLLQPKLDWRLKLVDQNYKVKFGGTDEIAGQPVREIQLVPVRDSIPTRKMYVDVKHDVVLKYVVDTPQAGSIVLFDTKSVIFDRAAAALDFDMPTEASEARVHKRRGPTAIKSPSDSRDLAGFSARLVKTPPYGFRESGAYVFKDTRGAFVGVKLSDGMATLTVYQWRADKFKSAPTRDVRVEMTDAYGIKYGISFSQGDQIPDAMLQKIVEAYVNRSE